MTKKLLKIFCENTNAADYENLSPINSNFCSISAQFLLLFPLVCITPVLPLDKLRLQNLGFTKYLILTLIVIYAHAPTNMKQRP